MYQQILFKVFNLRKISVILTIFPSIFLQAVTGSKNSILNWIMKLNILMFFFCFLFFEKPWKIFHSIHLFLFLFGLDTYK